MRRPLCACRPAGRDPAGWSRQRRRPHQPAPGRCEGRPLRRPARVRRARRPAVQAGNVGVPSGAPVLEALNAGALDIGFTGDIPFLFVYAAGAPLKAVGAWHFNPATVALVVGDSPIRSVAGLRASALPSIAAAGAFPRPWRVASRRPRTAGRKLFLPWSGGRPRRPGAWLGRRLGALGALYLQRRAARSGAGHRQRCRDHDRLLLCPGQRRCDRPQEGRDQRPADPPGACPGLGPEAPGGVRRGPWPRI